MPFDAASSTSGLGVGSLTWGHTVAADANGLFVEAGFGTNSAAAAVTSITYGGVALPNNLWEIDDAIWVYNNCRHLPNPAAGTASIVVTYTGSVTQACAGAVSWKNLHPTTPYGTPATAFGSSAIASVAVASAVGDIVLGSISTDSESITPTGTQRWEVENLNADTSYGAQTYDGAPSVTVRWDQLNAGWAVGGVSMKELLVAATGLLTPPLDFSRFPVPRLRRVQ